MNIKQKLVLSFSLMTVVPLLTLSAISFFNFQNILSAEIDSNLENSIRLKIKAIDTFYTELRSDITIAQDYFNIKNNLPILIRYQERTNSPEYKLAKETLDSQMRTLQRVKGFSDLMLTDLNGKIIYSTNPLHEEIDIGKNISDFGDIFKNFRDDSIFISDIFTNQVPGKDYNYGILAYGPARNLKSELIGGIFFELNAQSFYDILKEKTGSGITTETLIGKLIGDNELIYLSPLLKSDLPPLELKVPIKNNGTTFPLARALLNKSAGSGLTADYAGDEVMARWHYLPDQEWGLVVKTDTWEAFQAINYLKYLTYVVLLLLFGIIGFAILKISKDISEPLKELQNGVEVITSGNLDYKVGKNSKDEIGKLSRAFDTMTEKLKESYDKLNAKVEEKTAELAAKVSELKKMNSYMVDREIKMIELKKEIEALKSASEKK